MHARGTPRDPRVAYGPNGPGLELGTSRTGFDSLILFRLLQGVGASDVVFAAAAGTSTQLSTGFPGESGEAAPAAQDE